MFWIFAGFAQLIGSMVFNANMDLVTKENRERAVRDGNEFYFDSRGKMFKISPTKNDIECYEQWDLKTGHRVLVDAKSKLIIKDYDLDRAYDNEINFKKAYNEAKEKAIKEGKKYFYVIGLEAIDARYGYYEVETEKLISLDRSGSIYLKTYWEVTNGRLKVIESKVITQEEYKELGGDFTHFLWQVKAISRRRR